MSNPTTPFSWQMPQNTDLVTDLPADFEVFGQAVATSMQDLLGGTTGQLLSKASGTDMDFTWTSANPGDITGVTAGVGISGGGTSGDVTVTNSMATAFTTSGDLIQATGSGTFARLGTGTNGQYLTTNGTTNSWASVSAGGMTLLSTTTLSGATTTISGIVSGYEQLFVRGFGQTNATAEGFFRVAINAQTTLSSYAGVNPTPNAVDKNQQRIDLMGESGNPIARSDGRNIFTLIIDNYASSTAYKSYVTYGAGEDNIASIYGGYFKSNTAITSLVFDNTGGSLTGGTIQIYGVK